MPNRIIHIVIWCAIPLCGISQQTERQYLSGTGNDHPVNWEFYCTAGMNAGRWTTIAVPSCWETQGFGKYDYGFARDSLRGHEQGMYKYHFRVPAAWKGKVVKIVFEGVMTDASVSVNGQLAGEPHQGAFYSFAYDISAKLKYDADNLLEVTVAKQSANASVNAAERKADFWLFGGIFRPVFLEALPPVYIESVAIDAKAGGMFRATLHSSKPVTGASIQLFDVNGNSLGAPMTGKKTAAANEFLFTGKYTAAQNWTPESPRLYHATVSILSGHTLLHRVSCKFGFRTVELRMRDGIYVNGVKVKMKGVNRHSFWPSSGRTTSPAISINDVLTMKDMNMNAVRMSHYPPDDHFLDACDSLGLFVMDELAGWHGHYDTPTGMKLLKEMMDHDRNHPSIIFWNNGNEGGHNLDLDSFFTAWDIQKRPVVHPWQVYNGIDAQHYREYNYGIGNYEHGHDIIMPTEFLHGLYDGGQGAGLADYWEAMWHNPLAAGGFLWDFADEGVVRKDRHDSLDTDGNHGADGIMGPYHEKEGSYYAIKEIWSPVRMIKKEITAQFDGRLQVENRYFFTNLNTCRFSWKLEGLFSRRKDSGTIIAPSIAPGQTGTLFVNLPAYWHSRDYADRFDVLYITAKDPNGRELFTWSYPITLPDEQVRDIMQAADTVHAAGVLSKNAPLQLTETDTAFVVHAGACVFTFSKANGLLREVKYRNTLIPFHNGPQLQQGETNFSGLLAMHNADSIVIASRFDKKVSFNRLTWVIYANGILKMELQYFPGAYFTDFIGANFSFPETELSAVTYEGSGPYRVWKNRLAGTRFGLWNKTYNNTETGESWLYPEFKGYYSNMYACFFKTRGIPFSVFSASEDIFLRLFTPAWKTDQWHNYETIFPSGDISFMQGIPAIGTKTQRNETTGPMGMKNIFYDYEKDPSRALHMVLYFRFGL